MEAKQFLEKSRDCLAQKAFAVESNRSFNGAFSADLYALKKGRSLGIFFPYEDHLFFHVLEGAELRGRSHVEILHEKARTFVNSLFKLPRAMRYKVPNIVTVVLSCEGFSREMIDYALKPKTSIIGGEKHSVILVDLMKQGFYSHGLETTYSGGIGIAFKQVNPDNRAILLIDEITRSM